MRQESRAADAGRQVIRGGVLHLVALLRRALPAGRLARPVLVVWEPPDRQDSIVAQADFIRRAVQSRLRGPRGVERMTKSSNVNRQSESGVGLSPLGVKEGGPPASEWN